MRALSHWHEDMLNTRKPPIPPNGLHVQCRQTAAIVLLKFSCEISPSVPESRPTPTVGSSHVVVPATFVCQNHPYASEILEDNLWYFTGSEF